MLVGIPLLILSAMFIASLKRKRPPEVVTVEDVPEIIVDAPPPIAHITSSIPPHLPAPGQPVGFAKLSYYWVTPKILAEGETDRSLRLSR